MRAALTWAVTLAALSIPLIAAAFSPLLQWRSGVYIAAGFAGIAALALLFLQALLAGNLLPGLSLSRSRTVHKYLGTFLVLAVLVHVGGLWITSPPDVIDVFLLRSPTPFSTWGLLATFGLLAAAALAGFRRKISLRPTTWARLHTTVALVVVLSTALHALLITGTMEPISKAILCALAVIASLCAITKLRTWRSRARTP